MLAIKCKVMKSKLGGKGLFSMEFLPKGKMVGILAQEAMVMSEDKYQKEQKKGNYLVIMTAVRWVGNLFLYGDKITKEEGLDLTTYTGIRSIVSPYNMNSELLKEIQRTGSKRMPPPPKAALDTASINMLKKWINQGATNKICIDDCDTSSVKYSTHIAPLINTYCKGCHQTSSPGGGIILENLTQVKSQIISGNLMCSIKWSGCSNMPKGGNKFSNCNIRKFEIWQNTGFPQ
jgi:hypothetical protein